ncbi:PHP domain-containing protein [bacterium]|nr:PHP domain-containing protein [bacterium]
MNFVDFHTHSTASDGELSPTELVETAARKGLTAIAISDHDTMQGIEEALAAGEANGIKVIPAVEISVNDDYDSLHMLGYFVDQNDEELNVMLYRVQNSRDDRNLKILSKLNELGYPLDAENVLRDSEDGTSGRVHIANALVNAGLVNTFQEAFDKLLTKGGPAYVDRYRPSVKEAIEVIHHAGGLAVWAHPGLHEEKLEALLSRLPVWIEFGLDGLESDYCIHSLKERDRLRALALENNLIYTGGSDFHGSIKPQNALGCGPEGTKVDEKCLTMLIQSIYKYTD